LQQVPHLVNKLLQVSAFHYPCPRPFTESTPAWQCPP
jgi:hypothetical protein